MARSWTGPLPAACDVCDAPLFGTGRPGKPLFVDGRTRSGQWANMGVACGCFQAYGVGLGTGLGQAYDGDGLKLQAERTPAGGIKLSVLKAEGRVR